MTTNAKQVSVSLTGRPVLAYRCTKVSRLGSPKGYYNMHVTKWEHTTINICTSSLAYTLHPSKGSREQAPFAKLTLALKTRELFIELCTILGYRFLFSFYFLNLFWLCFIHWHASNLLKEQAMMRLGRGTADEEPLVDGAVDLLGGKLLVGGEGRQLRGADAAVGVLNSDVGARGQASQ